MFAPVLKMNDCLSYAHKLLIPQNSFMYLTDAQPILLKS